MGSAADLPLWAAFVAALAPAGALLVASIAALIAWRSHARQKRADRHQNLWTSLTWALDQLADPQDEYKVKLGMSVLTSLGRDPLIDKTDNRLLGEVNAIVAERSSGPTMNESPGHEMEQGSADYKFYAISLDPLTGKGIRLYTRSGEPAPRPLQKSPPGFVDEGEIGEPGDTPAPGA